MRRRIRPSLCRRLAAALAAAGLATASGSMGAQVPSREYVYAGERLLAVIPPPGLSIDDVAVLEGPPGTRMVTFTVRLSATLTQAVSASYATANGTATAGVDYQAASGTVTIPAGSTSATINVSVVGDTTAEPEPREHFFVNLSNPTRAALVKAQGRATIIDDEAARYFALPPCRILDTRNPPTPPLTSGSTRPVQVTGRCGVPPEARAAALNVTAAAPTGSGNLRLYAAPGPAPLTSVLNFAADKPRANNAIVTIGQDGQVTVMCDLFLSIGQTHVVIDVMGYFR